MFGLKRHLSAMPKCSVKIGEETIESVDVVENLGVLLDTQLDMRSHISHVVKVCRFHIRRAWNIRRFVNEDTTIQIMLSIVMCRLDYNNFLLVNLSQKDIAQLQLIQNGTFGL